MISKWKRKKKNYEIMKKILLIYEKKYTLRLKHKHAEFSNRLQTNAIGLKGMLWHAYCYKVTQWKEILNFII